MQHKERISLMDNTKDILLKMSDGNPGALTVMLQLLDIVPKIDPDNLMGGLGTILLLDSYGIYGTDIYILHNDICERDFVKTVSVLRATQMGFLPSAKLVDACSRQDRSGKALIPVEELYLKVKEALPDFDKKKEEVQA